MSRNKYFSFFISIIIICCFGVHCTNVTTPSFDKTSILGQWWRCSWEEGLSIYSQYNNAQESIDIITFDGNLFKEYWNGGSETTLYTWSYTLDNNFLTRHSIKGNAGTGSIYFISDTMVIERDSTKIKFMKYIGEIPPSTWSQTIVYDTIL